MDIGYGDGTGSLTIVDSLHLVVLG